jgi:hypothetical protein
MTRAHTAQLESSLSLGSPDEPGDVFRCVAIGGAPRTARLHTDVTVSYASIRPLLPNRPGSNVILTTKFRRTTIASVSSPWTLIAQHCLLPAFLTQSLPTSRQQLLPIQSDRNLQRKFCTIVGTVCSVYRGRQHSNVPLLPERLIGCPCCVNSVVRRFVLLHVQRSGDCGSPRVFGSTNRSNASIRSESLSANCLRPPPTPRKRDSIALPASRILSSATPLRIVCCVMPVAWHAAVTPPPP